MQRLISVVLLVALAFISFTSPSEATVQPKVEGQPKATALPTISAQAAAIFDLTTGEVLAGINAGQKVFPASTTKVLTALLAIELGELTDMVTISKLAEQQEGTALYCRAGEQYSFQDLLYALLVLSANDVAVALAEHVAGSVESFAQLMNDKALALGAKNSHFVNPNGLPDPDHYTTAADMAKIFVAAYQQPLIREITATRVYYIDLPSGERRALVNGNKMLTEYSGTLGGKTGYTSQAGNCLVTAAQSGSLKLGVSVFKAQGKAVWDDARALLDYGFSHWCNLALIHREQVVTAMSARYGTDVLLRSGDELQITRTKGDEELPVTWELSLDKPLQAPLEAGQVVGHVTYFVAGEEVGAVRACVAHAVPRNWYTYWEVGLAIGCIAISWRLIEGRAKRSAARQPAAPKRR
ncbi:MAG TPA: hypothetical protein DDZ53_07575 [Firmicutes bacterium]|nr:hypothetical protein [Bacillota bacterium]